MSDAIIGLWGTKEALNNDPDMLTKIENGLKTAYGDQHNAIIGTYPDEPVDAPQQSISDDISGGPCGYNKNYDTLLPWWKDYHNCNGLTDYNDTNLLVTNGSGKNGKAYYANPFAVAAGEQISDLPLEPAAAGCSNGYDALNTVIHEHGHNLDLTHDMGNLYDYDSYDEFYTSPM